MEILEPRVSKKNTVDTERRREIRSKALKGAKLAFNSGFGALECVVRDLSPHGARLRFGNATAVPSHFSLHIPSDPGERSAVVCWRGGNEVGIRMS